MRLSRQAAREDYEIVGIDDDMGLEPLPETVLAPVLEYASGGGRVAVRLGDSSCW